MVTAGLFIFMEELVHRMPLARQEEITSRFPLLVEKVSYNKALLFP